MFHTGKRSPSVPLNLWTSISIIVFACHERFIALVVQHHLIVSFAVQFLASNLASLSDLDLRSQHHNISKMDWLSLPGGMALMVALLVYVQF